jgi:hypothetical protein
MTYVMRCVEMSGMVRILDGHPDQRGCYLAYYDPEFADGVGAAGWVTNPVEAIAFEAASAGLDLWLTESKTRPTRWDGEPNKPLTAYTVEMIPLEQAIEEYVNRDAKL